MLDGRVATKTEAGKPCRGCGNKLKAGDPILAIELPKNLGLPYNYRMVYIHASCARHAVRNALIGAKDELLAGILS